MKLVKERIAFTVLLYMASSIALISCSLVRINKIREDRNKHDFEAVKVVPTVTPTIIPTVTPTVVPTITPTIAPTNKPVKREAKQPTTDEQTVIYNKIGEIWGKDAEIGRKIAYCESRYSSGAKNGASTASGVFQFLRGTWIEQRKKQGDDTNTELRFDMCENIKTAYNHFKRLGTRPWNSSKICWGY